MFTGLIEEVGTFEGHDGAGRHRFRASVVLEGLATGDSISVNGSCLTVVARAPGLFEADVTAETGRRTTLALLRPEDPVNLERPVRMGRPSRRSCRPGPCRRGRRGAGRRAGSPGPDPS